MGNARATQVPAEGAYAPTAPGARATQAPVETAMLPAAPQGRITQVVVEVVLLAGGSRYIWQERPTGRLVHHKTAIGVTP